MDLRNVEDTSNGSEDDRRHKDRSLPANDVIEVVSDDELDMNPDSVVIVGERRTPTPSFESRLGVEPRYEIEEYSEEDYEYEPPPELDDVVITNISRAPSVRTRNDTDDLVGAEFERNVRPRLHSEEVPSLEEDGFDNDDDLQIVEERRLPNAVPFGESRNNTVIFGHGDHYHVHSHGPPFVEGVIPMRAENIRSRRLLRNMNNDGESLFRRAITFRFGEGQALVQLLLGSGEFPGFEDNNFSSMNRSIMERIERDNEQEMDRRLESENKFNRKTLLDKKAQIKREVKGYTNDIHKDANLGCELCGITLGEGIPEDFKTNIKYNQDYAKYQEEFGVAAPWFCSLQITDVDKDLSKRVFLSKCGHIYCGRCIKNIGNRPRGKNSKKKLLSMENPAIYAPSSCPAVGCEHKFRGKKSFIELFF